MRLKVLAAKEASIQEILSEAKARLRDVSKNPQNYKKLLQDLLVQVCGWAARQLHPRPPLPALCRYGDSLVHEYRTAAVSASH